MPAELQPVVRVRAAEHGLALEPVGGRERLDRADRAADRERRLHVDLLRAQPALRVHVRRVLARHEQRRAEAVVQVEPGPVEPLRLRAVGGLHGPHVAEERVRAAGRDAEAVVVGPEVHPRRPEPRPAASTTGGTARRAPPTAAGRAAAPEARRRTPRACRRLRPRRRESRTRAQPAGARCARRNPSPSSSRTRPRVRPGSPTAERRRRGRSSPATAARRRGVPRGGSTHRRGRSRRRPTRRPA